jgi:hypothetical protein
MSGTAKFDVLVCGSPLLDIVVNAPVIPHFYEAMAGSAGSKVSVDKGASQVPQQACCTYSFESSALAHVNAAIVNRVQ